MSANMRRALLVVVLSAVAGAGSIAWGDHGHGGGGWGHGGGGWSHSGGFGHINNGHFGGHSGFNNHWGGGIRFYTGYRNFGWPFSYYRPYAYSYFGYPYLYGYSNYPSGYYGYPSYYSYPSDYYANSNDYYYGDTPPPAYVVGRPVSDVARVEVRLPDPQGMLWVQGQEINSSGSVRQFRSPQLDPSQPYTYTVKAEWNDNGKRVTDERRVRVQANALAVVDFNQPSQAAADARRPAMPDLPPPERRPAVE